MNCKKKSSPCQNSYAQEQNHDVSSVDVVDMSTHENKVTEHLEKANSSENTEEIAEPSSTNIPQAVEILTIAEVSLRLVPAENNSNQSWEDILAKFNDRITENTDVNLETSFVKEEGLYITLLGNLESVITTYNKIFEWCEEHDLTLSLISKQEHCFVIDKTGEETEDFEQEAERNTQIISPHNKNNCVSSVDAYQAELKSSDGSQPTSAKSSKDGIQTLEMEKTFNDMTVEPYAEASDNISQETEGLSSANVTDIGNNESQQNVEQTNSCENNMTEKTNMGTDGVMMKFKDNGTIGLRRNLLEEILERAGDLTDHSTSDSQSDSMTQHSDPENAVEVFNEVDHNDDYVVSPISAPSWLHRYIIGKKGEKMAEIKNSVPNVHIHFTDEDKITLKGPIDDVNYAKEKFYAIINDIISRMECTEIKINSKFLKYLTGNNEEILNRIIDNNQVSITMFPENETNHSIKIEGESLSVHQAKKELLDLIRNLEEEHSQHIIIKHQFHHVLIGHKGERVHEIRKKFPDVFLNFPHPKEKSDIVQLIGPKCESEKCAKYLENMLTDIKENNYSVSVPIIKRLHKRIIGKGGSNVKKISESTNTKIRYPPENSNSEEFIITGYPENCEIARSWLLSIQQEIADTSEEQISIPPNLYKSLNNPKDCLVNSLTKECGKVHLHFPRNKSGLHKVIIIGSIENVEKTKAKLLKLAEEEDAKSYSGTVRVKSQYHQFLVNKNGGNISKICEENRTCVIFPNVKSKDQDYITITGNEEDVKEVQKQLEILNKDLEDEVEDYILISRKFHHYFVMRRVQLLREMREEYGGVVIAFSYAGKQNTKVTLRGVKACVEAAKKHIQNIFEPLGSQVTTRYVIPHKFQPFIMGTINSRIQQIAKDYKVQIKLPDIEKPATNMELSVQERGKEKWRKNTKELASNSSRKNDTIFISGQVENCKAATKALASLIPVTAEIHVPFHLRPYIIGHKGSGLRKLAKEFEVHIQILQSGRNSDIICIMGLAANVDQAKIKLQKQVKTLQMEMDDRTLRNFKLIFNLDAKYRSKITGHKGLLVAQICTEHDVTIHFPKKGSHEMQDQIIITGYKENTLAARDAMMRVLHKIEKTVSKEIPLNHQVRGNIIGYRGKNIYKIMDQYQVDIRFPPKGSYNPNISLTGLPDNVEKAIEHILNLQKYYLSVDISHASQQEHKSVSLGSIAVTPPKNFVRRYVPCYAKTTTKLPNVDNCEHFPRLKQRTSKTHPSKL